MKLLYLIRGEPGSGKSTLAGMFVGRYGYKLGRVPKGEERCMTVEADEYFINPDGEYEFNANELPDAHRWCQESARCGMKLSIVVIVSNTFSRNREMDPYKKMASEFGYSVFVVECQNNFGDTHDVPEGVTRAMRNRWERNRRGKANLTDSEGETLYRKWEEVDQVPGNISQECEQDVPFGTDECLACGGSREVVVADGSARVAEECLLCANKESKSA